MRRALLTAAFLLLAALCASADDKGPPKDAKDLHERLKLKRMREEIFAELREEQRKKLLAVYRRNADFHASWRIVHDHKTGEDDYKTHYYLTLFSERGRTIAHLYATEAADEPVNAVWVLSPERLVLNLSRGTPPVIARGRSFTQARSDRINAAIAALNREHEWSIRPLEAMRRSVDLTLRQEEGSRPKFNFSLGMETGSGETPSWLEPDLWAQHELSGARTAYAKLTRDGLTCWVDRETGLLELLRLKYADGSAWSWARRLNESVISAESLRKWLARSVATPLNERGLALDGATRLLALRLLLNNLVAAPSYDPKAACDASTAGQLIRAVFEDALAADELSALIRWGAAQVEAMRAAAPERAADELRSIVLRDMRERLFERWWGPIGNLQGALTPDDPIQLRVPPSTAPLTIALRGAIRAYVQERVAAAWAD